jgi:hypothetical protein
MSKKRKNKDVPHCFAAHPLVFAQHFSETP